MLFSTQWLDGLQDRIQAIRKRQRRRQLQRSCRRRKLQPAWRTEPMEERLLLNGAPTFDADSYAFDIAEDAAVGTEVGAVSATDPEGESLEYHIQDGNLNDAFSITYTEGVILVAASLDYESVSTYTLTVSVSDYYGNSDTAEVVIDVSDVNEAPRIENYTGDPVEEDSPVGSEVGWVSASDPDGDTLSYSITAGNTGSAFAIDNSGTITVAGELDYEESPSYTLTIQVSDGALTDTIDVTIDITNINESPVITDFAAIHVEGDTWTFEGTVWDENPETLVINFGGILEGHSAAVDVTDTYTGSFSYTLDLAPDQEGEVTAQTVDEYGLESNIARDTVSQT